MHKLDHFYAMCQLENTHVRQTYVGLFNRVLRNAVRVKCQQASVSKDDISDLLLTRKEPLKPLMLPDAIPPAMFQLQSRVSHLSRSYRLQAALNVTTILIEQGGGASLGLLEAVEDKCVIYQKLKGGKRRENQTKQIEKVWIYSRYLPLANRWVQVPW